MPRRGRHRTSVPTRLIAIVAALLVTTGVAVAAGSAAADPGSDSGSDSGLLSALTGDDSSGGQSDSEEGQNGDGQNGDGQNGDGQNGDGQNADGQNADGQGRQGGQDDGQDQQNGQGDDQGRQDGQDNGQNGQDNGQGDDQGQQAQEAAKDPFPGRDEAAPAGPEQYVDINDVEAGSGGPDKGGVFGGGSYTSACGTSDHRNSDNYQAAPGKENGAQHVHDYIGNTTTDASSSDESLEAGDTTCTNGDKSTYYWPVVRNLNGVGADANADGGGKDGNTGEILTATSAEMTYHGHPGQQTQPMPRGLEMITGDAKAKTNGDENVVSKWTCTGFTDRVTTKYPICPRGSQLVRILDFPSCWDGENLHSNAKNDAVVFPGSDGRCSGGRTPIPQLRMTLTYDQPEGRSFALDTFPDQQHDPRTDHGNFENVMSENLAREAADCINGGRTC